MRSVRERALCLAEVKVGAPFGAVNLTGNFEQEKGACGLLKRAAQKKDDRKDTRSPAA